jgi:hypothetical protein
MAGGVARDCDGEAVAETLPHEGDKFRRRAEAVLRRLPAAGAVGGRVAAEDHEAADARLCGVGKDTFRRLTREIGAGEMHLNVETADCLGGYESFQCALARGKRPCDINKERRRLHGKHRVRSIIAVQKPNT